VPRTRRFAPITVVRAYARRPAQVDRMILSCFVLGLCVRKVSEALLPILGRPISPTTVSAVAKQLDAVVGAFHARPLKDRYRVLMLDGVVLARRTGAGAIRRPVLVALGLRPDGKKEVIDFRLAASESAAAWERFLDDLIRRGLTGGGLEMICVDGGSGLLAALPTAYLGVPVQRCWAHKIRNVLDKVRCADQPAVKAALHAVMNAKTLPQARSAARRLADRWEAEYPPEVQEVVLPHQAQHPLVIGRPAGTAQPGRDPAIAVMPVLERQLLDRVPEPGLLLARRRSLPVTVIAGPAHPGQPAHPVDPELALRQRRAHRFDDRVDAVAPGAPFGRRASLTCRKAR